MFGWELVLVQAIHQADLQRREDDAFRAFAKTLPPDEEARLLVEREAARKEREKYQDEERRHQELVSAIRSTRF